MTQSDTTTTVRRQILVNSPIGEAFTVFTGRFGDFKLSPNVEKRPLRNV